MFSFLVFFPPPPPSLPPLSLFSDRSRFFSPGRFKFENLDGEKPYLLCEFFSLCKLSECERKWREFNVIYFSKLKRNIFLFLFEFVTYNGVTQYLVSNNIYFKKKKSCTGIGGRVKSHIEPFGR
mgnify:CR=1 FL=1